MQTIVEYVIVNVAVGDLTKNTMQILTFALYKPYLSRQSYTHVFLYNCRIPQRSAGTSTKFIGGELPRLSTEAIAK
jgi:hypothetical protein